MRVDSSVIERIKKMVVKPSDLFSGTTELERALMLFEAELRLMPKDKTYYHAIITKELSRKICDAVQELYLKAGWKKAVCTTSSEKGERPGLTGLQLHL